MINNYGRQRLTSRSPIVTVWILLLLSGITKAFTSTLHSEQVSYSGDRGGFWISAGDTLCASAKTLHSLGIIMASFPPPDKFTGGGDSARRFFQRFEIYATAKEWTNDAKKATQVMLLLGDSPFDYAVELPDATRASYDALKKEIIKRYETGDLSDNYILEFQGLRYTRGEDPLLYMSKLRRVAGKAYPDVTEAAREKLVLSQFTLGLPVELRRQVHLLDVKPENAADLVEKVKLFAQVDSSMSGGACARVEQSSSGACAEESELSVVMAKLEDLSREVASWRDEGTSLVAKVSSKLGDRRSFRGTCFRCRRSGHMARDCPSRGAVTRQSGAPQFTCYTCGNDGHRSPECALNRGSKTCPKCGNSGHGGSDCKYQGRSGLN